MLKFYKTHEGKTTEIEGYTALIFSMYGRISLRSLSAFEPKNTLITFDKISIVQILFSRSYIYINI